MTNEEKQIEEIKQLARDIFDPKTAIDGIDLAFAAVHGADRDDTHFMRIATHLYGKGYRKASDVAKEIFAEIKKVIGDKYECYVFDNINIEGVEQDAIIAFVDAMSNHFAELKKKYESEEEA